jgi:hypothetical protein
VCGARRDRARRKGTEVVDARKRELHEERHLDKLQRTAGRPPSAKGQKPIGRVRKASREREAESDDEVRRDIPSELVGVFNRVRRNIRGNDRKSRSEAFLVLCPLALCSAEATRRKLAPFRPLARNITLRPWARIQHGSRDVVPNRPKRVTISVLPYRQTGGHHVGEVFSASRNRRSDSNVVGRASD